MKSKIKFRNMAVAIYSIAVVLFLFLFIYMGLSENVFIYKTRESHTYTEIVDYNTEEIVDDTAPAGVRRAYKWLLYNPDSSEKCLCFYVVHQYVQVYLEEELVYSLTASENNRIGGSISSNWVTVPIYQEDNGKEITVILTPLFESMIDYDVEFLFGSHLAIVFDQLTQDLSQMFLSVLCVLLGIFIMAVQFYFTVRTKSKTWDMFFLGSFSVLLGVYRMADMVSSPLLFPDNPMVLGYITIGALFLCGIPLLLFASTCFTEKQAVPLMFLAILEAVGVLIVWGLQVIGIAEFKETLTISHLMLIVSIGAALVVAFVNRKKPGSSHQKSHLHFGILAVGIFLDIILFYLHKSSSNVICTTIAFIVYAIVMFITRVVDTTQKAYADERTGLSNKAYWDELMNEHVPVRGSIGIIMMDLNGLKQVNDKLGHEAGDRMIFDFSHILRNVLPSDSVICRWGGDEFAVLMTEVDREKVEVYVETIQNAVEDYNASNSHASIFFAVGFAVSAEYPGLSRKELLSIADSQMYLNKQRWYSEHQI